MVEMHEVKNLIEVWVTVIIALSYCFKVGKIIEKGKKRLFLVVPVMLLFLSLPLHLSSVHLIGTTSFFISWIANFKLSLYAFGKGPLSVYPQPLSLPLFLLVSCFPIKIKLDPKKQSTRRESSLMIYVLKLVLVCFFIKSYDYINQLSEKMVLLLYAIHMYLLVDLILAFTASMVQTASRLEIEPQFKAPYLATSLQDFWGKRWNLMVSDIMRPTVYQPMLELSVFPREWTSAIAVFGTFAVSGIMHELIFFYMGRLRPSWRMISFFLLHGFSTMVEIVIKKSFNTRCKLPTAVSRVLTVGFVLATGIWLFFPEFKRCKIDEKAFEDYAAIGGFLRKLAKRFRG